MAPDEPVNSLKHNCIQLASKDTARTEIRQIPPPASQAGQQDPDGKTAAGDDTSPESAEGAGRAQ